MLFVFLTPNHGHHDIVGAAEEEQKQSSIALDLNVFKEIESHDDCNGDPSECPKVRRLLHGLKYYALLRSSRSKQPEEARSLFVEFCVAAYSKEHVLADYIHYVAKHSDDASRRAIAKEIDFGCRGIRHCQATQRHYRDRSVSDAQPTQRVKYRFLLDCFDALHFNLLHLEEVGLREAPDAKHEESDADQDDEGLVDHALGRLVRDIEAKRHNADFQRADEQKHSKFNIVVGSDEKKEGQKGMHPHGHIFSQVCIIRSCVRGEALHG